jgi:hypothetical protein
MDDDSDSDSDEDEDEDAPGAPPKTPAIPQSSAAAVAAQTLAKACRENALALKASATLPTGVIEHYTAQPGCSGARAREPSPEPEILFDTSAVPVNQELFNMNNLAAFQQQATPTFKGYDTSAPQYAKSFAVEVSEKKRLSSGVDVKLEKFCEYISVNPYIPHSGLYGMTENTIILSSVGKVN